MKALLSIESAAKDRGYGVRHLARLVREMDIKTVNFPFHGGRGVKYFLKREDVDRIPVNTKRIGEMV